MANWLANTVDRIGTFFNLPEYGYSERIAGGTPTVNTGLTPQSQAAGLDNWVNYHFSNTSSASTPDQTTTTTTRNQTPATTSSTGVSVLDGWGKGTFTGQEVGSNGTIYRWNGSQWVPIRSEGSYQAPSGPSDEQLNAIYNPLLSSLNQRRATEEEFYNSARGDLANEQTTALERLAQQKQGTTELLNQQNTDLGNQKEDALSRAIRSYQGLAQRGNVLYGGASSTGRAMGELAAKEYYRNEGGIQRTFAEQFGKLQSDVRKAELFYTNSEKDIKDKYLKAFTQLYQGWKRTMDQISAAQFGIESDRAQKKLDVEQEYQRNFVNMENQRQAELNQLQAFKEELNYQLAAEYASMAQGLYQTPQQTFSASAPKLNFQTGQQSVNSNQLSMMNRKPVSQEDELDEYYSMFA